MSKVEPKEISLERFFSLYRNDEIDELLNNPLINSFEFKFFKNIFSLLFWIAETYPDFDHWVGKNFSEILIGRDGGGKIVGLALFRISINAYEFEVGEEIEELEGVLKESGKNVIIKEIIGKRKNKKICKFAGFGVGVAKSGSGDFDFLNFDYYEDYEIIFGNSSEGVGRAKRWIENVVELCKKNDKIWKKFASGNGSAPSGRLFRDILDDSQENSLINISDLVVVDPENKIYYGPPGTGKTHRLQRLQREQFTDELVGQPHEIFLQEQVRFLTWAQVVFLVLLEQGQPMICAEIVRHEIFQAKADAMGRKANLFGTALDSLYKHARLDLAEINFPVEKRSSQSYFDRMTQGKRWFLLEEATELYPQAQKILQHIQEGPRQTEQIQRYCSVTFHQSYGYEDFIEGLRPVMDEDSDRGQIGYEIKKGVFVELCERARHDPNHHYAIFIDEINRGNVSRIFGELISLIELNKREGAAHEMSVVLPYSRTLFGVPRNVSIIGSMNIADRSLTPLDTALRRRFEFVEVMPEPALLEMVDGVDLEQLLRIINQRIEALIGRDYVIGHAYFLPVKTLDDLRQVFAQKIIPLLAEYFFEDWSKIRLVLRDHMKPLEQQLVQEVLMDAQALFGQLSVPVLPRYQVNAELQQPQGRFAQPDVYQAMYA